MKYLLCGVAALAGVSLLVWWAAVDTWTLPPPAGPPPDSAVYARDTMALAYAAEYGAWSGYERFSSRGMRPDEVEARIDTIFYSPDTLKLFAFVVAKIKTHRLDTTGWAYSYDGQSMAGYRARRDTCWTLFYPEDFFLIGAHSSESASEKLVRYYLSDDFRETSMYAHENGQAILREFEYTPADSLFWTQSVMWEKGAQAPERYYFETTRDPTMLDETRTKRKSPIPTPYPDRIRQMYGTCEGDTIWDIP